MSLSKAIVAGARLVTGVLVFVSLGLNLTNVASRYLFSAPIIWTEELMVFILVWCVFIGAVMTTWEGRHLKMDILSTMLPSPWKQLVNGAVAVLCIVVTGLVVPQSYDAVKVMMESGARSMTGQFSMVIPHAALLVGFTLMPIVVILRFRAYVSGDFGGEDDRLREDGAEVKGE